jgi:hypothetical protein
MEGFAFALVLSPEPELLGQPAVVGSASCPEGQAEICGGTVKMFEYCRNFLRTGFEQILKELAVFRCFGMQRESSPANAYVIFVLQSFNTPGNEITPGSDIIGKDFQFDWLFHRGSSLKGERRSEIPGSQGVAVEIRRMLI